EPHFCHVSCSICHTHLSIMLFARASKVRIGSLPVAEIMVGMNPTSRWSVATHLIVGVNTPPRLKSCGFWANPPVGKLSAQGLIPAPLEDDDRGVVVPIEGHAASALDPTIPERKVLEDGTATRARLGRVGRIDLDDLATSTFSLV